MSVLDFTPNPEGGSPEICINRLNQVSSVVMDENRLTITYSHCWLSEITDE